MRICLPRYSCAAAGSAKDRSASRMRAWRMAGSLMAGDANDGAGALDHWRRRRIELGDDRLGLGAEDRVDGELEPVGLAAQIGILESAAEGGAQNLGAVARHARRRHERPAERQARQD